MKNKSYWQDITLPKGQVVKQNLNVDVAIIGGGMTGIMCAYFLSTTNLKVAVFEKNQLVSQTSSHTTAKITTMHYTLLQQLVEHFNEDVAKAYFESNLQAMDLIKDIITKHQIDCDFEECFHILYDDEGDLIEKEKMIYQKLNLKNQDVELKMKHQNFIARNQQARFHPLKYLKKIIQICQKNGVVFYENSKVENLKNHNLLFQFEANEYTINATHVVVSTRFPISIGFHQYNMQVYQSKSYLSFWPTKHKLKDCYLKVNDPLQTFRPVKDGMIIGGFNQDDKNQKYIVDSIKELGQNLSFNKMKLFWSTQDCMSNRILPYIGYYYSKDVFCYVATGFNKWGMTLSHISARLISDLILKKENQDIELFDPLKNRFDFKKSNTMTLLKHSYEGWIKNRLQMNKIIQSEIDGKVYRINYQLIGATYNHHHQLTKISPICSHQKGVLSFDYNDRSWTCRCHGSTFDCDGKVIFGPATKDLKKL